MTPEKTRKQRALATKSPFMSQESAFANLFDLRKKMFNLNRIFYEDLENRMNVFPAVNVKDLKDSFEVQLAAPGLEKSDFNITIDNGILTINAEKEQKKEQKKEEVEEGYIKKEFSYNSFSRSMILPDFIDEDKEVNATYKDGVLKLVLKKTGKGETPSFKKIKVS